METGAGERGGIMRKSLVAGVLAIAICICGVGCKKSSKEKEKEESSKKSEVDISSCVMVSAQGFDGMGVVDCSTDAEEINKVFKQTMKELYGDEIESSTKSDFDKLEKSIRVQAEPSNSVSNGDKITIQILYDEKKAEECNVEIKPDSIEYTVSGLTAIQSVDAFEGFQVSFSGTENNTQIILDNSGCSDFVRNYVVFSLDGSTIKVLDGNVVVKNGETITVKAEFGDNLPEDMEQVYVLANDSKSFNASGLDMYPTSINNLDVTEIVKLANDKGTGFVSNLIYNEIATAVTINGTWLDVSPDSFSISDYSVVPEKMYFASPKANTDMPSGIVIVFHVTYVASGKTSVYGSATETVNVDTYVAAGCFGFTSDEAQSVLKTTGETVVIGDSDSKDYICNDHSFETAYNAFVAPLAENYVVDEMDIAAYASVLG